MDLYLFDDRRARRWQPFSLTRPVGELLFGCLRLRERAERALGARALGHLAGESLGGYEEAGAPPVLEPAQVDGERPRILLSSRAVLEKEANADEEGPATLTAQGQVVGWILPRAYPTPVEAALLDPDGFELPGRRVELAANLLEWPWNLVEQNPTRVAADAALLYRGSNLFGLTDVTVVGDHQLSLGPEAHIEPGVVVDTRAGPVRLDARVYVQAPCRLSGPLYVGKDSLLFGGSIGGSSIGPLCKVRGEIDTSVLAGYCNKAHDGYLGHALLGQWVNLGALTTNSDLKNNYSPVRVALHGEPIETGLLKVGCFLGDHVKTAIGTLLGTGTVIGAGSNVFGERTPPRYVPPFSWGSGEERSAFELEKFYQTARAAMDRRGVELTPGTVELLRRAWEGTHGEAR